MTDNLTGRALDLALAEAQGWRVWLQTRGGYTHAIWCAPGAGGPWERTQRAYQHPEEYTEVSGHDIDHKKHVESDNYPRFSTSLDLIAAAEEPLVGTGWTYVVELLGPTVEVRWFPPWSYVDDDALVSVTAPDEVTARGNALLRGLEKLKEETK